MLETLADFIATSDTAVHRNTPQLRLELSAFRDLFLTLPFVIQFEIKRPDTSNESVIFEWEPYTSFTKSGFLLLHHTATRLEAVTIDHSDLVDGHSPRCWELVSGESVTFQVTLPERFQKVLEPGETYTLLWSGGNLATWDYGTMPGHIGRQVKEENAPLVLPGGSHITFSAHSKSQPWPMRKAREAQVGFERANMEEQQWRQFPPVENIERDPNAPVIVVSLQCPSTLCLDSVFDVIVKVTYQAKTTAPPITFHRLIFIQDHHYQLGRYCGGTWENYDQEEEECGFRLVDGPDIPVNVSQDDHFISLQPGESWTTCNRLGKGHGWTELPDDAQNGEVFRYVFTGGTLDWWNFGSKADHEGTVIKLP